MTENGIQINREVCGGCATCVAVCPTAAMELKGEVWERDALIAELVKDVSYIGKDGGVTFSGGEALMQSEFVTCALKRLQEMGIGTAVDTAGLVPAHALLGALPYTDVLLYDLKIFDREKHIEYTGAPNDLILKNIIAAADYAREHGTPEIWIRTPIIPGATDSDDNINHIGKFIAAYLDDAISRWELCAFNNLCLNKYERLGEEWDFAGISLVHAEEMEHLLDVAKDSGANPDKILWTGSTFVEK
jgi:pyruvate formate lyase activating enzyme